jgi:hypothetical protein
MRVHLYVRKIGFPIFLLIDLRIKYNEKDELVKNSKLTELFSTRLLNTRKNDDLFLFYIAEEKHIKSFTRNLFYLLAESKLIIYACIQMLKEIKENIFLALTISLA